MSDDPRGPSHLPAKPPGLAERAGCFAFVALPLVFGVPIARAYGALLGAWVLPLYILCALLLLGFIVYILERDEEK